MISSAQIYKATPIAEKIIPNIINIITVDLRE
jgi:hypothetical protein